ncbi:MAG: sulfatase [Deltaproteobacteria bacterium]|jgi:arylsulfatase A-like enzyme|nr:sulfatase [Deltaproteobacteria bacterium]
MPHHILLVSLDALRPDWLGCHGHRRGLSPNIDRLLPESLIFDNATSPTTWTLPGHMSMLCGLDPLVHGCVSARHRYPPEQLPFPLLFELLAEGGYVSQAVTGGGYMEAQFGFGRGVDDFRVIFPIVDALDAVVDHFRRGEPTFSFLHTYMVHDYPRVASRPGALRLAEQRDPGYTGFFPTDGDFHGLLNAMAASPSVPELTERDIDFLEDLYGSAILSADASLGGLRQRLTELGQWDSTTLIVTADHGESLGDIHDGRRFWSHGGPPYQEQIRVPLIVRPAAGLRDLLEPGRRVAEPVSLVDLAPTILDLAGVPYSRDQFDGSSIVDLAMGQVAAFETRTLVYHSCEDAEDRYLDPRLFGTALPWKGNTKLIYDHRSGALRELYRLDSDPHEIANLVDELSADELKQIQELIDDYYTRLEQRAHRPESAEIEDPVVLERLAQLGYIEEH